MILFDGDIAYIRTIYGAFTKVAPGRGYFSYSDRTRAKARAILINVSIYGFMYYSREDTLLCYLIARS